MTETLSPESLDDDVSSARLDYKRSMQMLRWFAFSAVMLVATVAIGGYFAILPLPFVIVTMFIYTRAAYVCKKQLDHAIAARLKLQ
jgi:hypothetical protein